MSDFAAILVFAGALLATVGIGEGLRSWAGWQPESSRRAVHVLTGLLVIVAVPWFSSPAWIYALALLFVGVNLVALSRGFFPGMHGIGRRSWGTVTFPLALIVALFHCWTLDSDRRYILQIAFLVLAVSDPLASFVGTRIKSPWPYKIGVSGKSLAGTTAFVFSSGLLVALGLGIFAPGRFGIGEIALAALIVAVVSGAAEALGGRGWDNLAIVISVVVPLAAVHSNPGLLPALLLAALVAALFGIAAYQAKFLELSGAIAASLLSFGVVGLGGLPWVLPGFAFFITSSLLSAAGTRHKQKAEVFAEKSSRRDAGQVLANGGVAGLLLIAHVFEPHPALYWAFVGSFAAAAADTWGTEIGTYVRGATRQMVTFKRVQPGESGGISAAGTIGALLGAGILALTAIPFVSLFSVGANRWETGALVVGSGFLASLVDSVLGATLQVRYRDSSGRLTERPVENGRLLRRERGFRWMTNDRVNLACTFVGGLVPLVYLYVRGSISP